MLKGNLVFLRGMIKGGTSAIVFTLPKGFRPKRHIMLTGIQGGNIVTNIQIRPTGGIQINNIGESWHSLDSLSFEIN